MPKHTSVHLNSRTMQVSARPCASWTTAQPGRAKPPISPQSLATQPLEGGVRARDEEGPMSMGVPSVRRVVGCGGSLSGSRHRRSRNGRPNHGRTRTRNPNEASGIPVRAYPRPLEASFLRPMVDWGFALAASISSAIEPVDGGGVWDDGDIFVPMGGGVLTCWSVDGSNGHYSVKSTSPRGLSEFCWMTESEVAVRRRAPTTGKPLFTGSKVKAADYLA